MERFGCELAICKCGGGSTGAVVGGARVPRAFEEVNEGSGDVLGSRSADPSAPQKARSDFDFNFDDDDLTDTQEKNIKKSKEKTVSFDDDTVSKSPTRPIPMTA